MRRSRSSDNVISTFPGAPITEMDRSSTANVAGRVDVGIAASEMLVDPDSGADLDAAPVEEIHVRRDPGRPDHERRLHRHPVVEPGDEARAAAAFDAFDSGGGVNGDALALAPALEMPARGLVEHPRHHAVFHLHHGELHSSPHQRFEDDAADEAGPHQRFSAIASAEILCAPSNFTSRMSRVGIAPISLLTTAE